MALISQCSVAPKDKSANPANSRPWPSRALRHAARRCGPTATGPSPAGSGHAGHSACTVTTATSSTATRAALCHPSGRSSQTTWPNPPNSANSSTSATTLAANVSPNAPSTDSPRGAQPHRKHATAVKQPAQAERATVIASRYSAATSVWVSSSTAVATVRTRPAAARGARLPCADAANSPAKHSAVQARNTPVSNVEVLVAWSA